MVLAVGGTRPHVGGLLRQLRDLAQAQGFFVVDLQPDPVDRRVPFGVVQDLLGVLRPSASAEEARGSPLSGFMAMAVMDARAARAPRSATRGTGVPHVAVPLTRTSDRAPQPEEVRAEVFELVRVRSERGPILLTVHPGESVDRPSVAFLAQLAREAVRLPVLAIVTLPRDPRGTDGDWDRLLKGVPVQWVDLPPGPTDAQDRAQVRRQLDQLPSETRRALAIVDIAGPDASAHVLEKALGESWARFGGILEPAITAGVLRRDGGTYAFTDVALRDEVARGVEATERKRLHGQVARALQEIAPKPTGKMIFRIAEHWSEAGAAERAVPAILAAGEEAIQRGAHEEAELDLRRALVLAQGLPGSEGRDLEEQTLALIGLALEMEGRPQDAIVLYDRAAKSAKGRRAGIEVWGLYLHRYARLTTTESIGIEAVEDRLREAIVEASKQHLPTLQAQLLATDAMHLLVHGRREEAKREAAQALSCAEESRDPETLARGHRMMALTLFTGSSSPGDLAEAASYLRRTIDHIPPDQARSELAFAYDDMSSVCCTAHDENQAILYGRKCIEVARKYCSRGDLLLMLGNFSEHQLHAKDLAGATATLEEIKTFADRYGLPDTHSVRQQWRLAEGLRRELAGDASGARQMLEETVALGERLGARDMMSQGLAYLVVTAVEHQDFEAARAYVRRIEKEGLKRALFANVRELLDDATRKIPPKGR